MTRALLLLMAFPRLVSTFAPPDLTPVSRHITSTAFTATTRSKALFSTSVPEPGDCPSCSDANGYWDGGNLFVCIACGNEWPVVGASSGDAADAYVGDDLTRDVNGNVLERGDTIVLVKDLGKGLKKGTKVKNIRLGDYGDGHDIEASIPGLGTYELKSQFLKKV